MFIGLAWVAWTAGSPALMADAAWVAVHFGFEVQIDELGRPDGEPGIAPPERGLPTTALEPRYLGLQAHPGSRVRVRNIRLSPL